MKRHRGIEDDDNDDDDDNNKNNNDYESDGESTSRYHRVPLPIIDERQRLVFQQNYRKNDFRPYIRDALIG
jgi:hypothetical protein